MKKLILAGFLIALSMNVSAMSSDTEEDQQAIFDSIETPVTPESIKHEKDFIECMNKKGAEREICSIELIQMSTAIVIIDSHVGTAKILTEVNEDHYKKGDITQAEYMTEQLRINEVLKKELAPLIVELNGYKQEIANLKRGLK